MENRRGHPSVKVNLQHKGSELLSARVFCWRITVLHAFVRSFLQVSTSYKMHIDQHLLKHLHSRCRIAHPSITSAHAIVHSNNKDEDSTNTNYSMVKFPTKIGEDILENCL
jgi:hypothetical protein